MTILCHWTQRILFVLMGEYKLKLDRTVQTATDLERERESMSKRARRHNGTRMRESVHIIHGKMCKCVDFSFAVRPSWLFIVWADRNDVRETEILRNYDDDNNYGCMVLMVIAILMRWRTDTSVFFFFRCYSCCFRIIRFNSFSIFFAL